MARCRRTVRRQRLRRSETDTESTGEIMRIGNLTQTVWKRSVKKQLHKRREAFLTEPLNGERCSAMKVDAQTSVVVTANASANGNTAKTATYAAIRAVNDLACRGADPAGIRLQCFLPKSMTEEQFRDLIGEAEAFCEEHDLELINVAAETSPAVRQIFVQAGAVGIGKNGVLPLGGASKGDEIVLCGSVGLEGALRILEEQEAELSQRFVPAFLRQTKALKRELCPLTALKAAVPHVRAMQQIGSGGILAALWELSEAAGAGFQVAMEQMTICQETVEICEYYRLNPYQMTSAGAVLIVTNEAQQLLHLLEKEGVRAARLGMIHDGNARVITSGEEVRYLDRPAVDELARWMAEHVTDR